MAQCTAHSKQSKQQCRNGSIPGGSVCRFHGGATPHVKAAAETRVKEWLESRLPKGLKRYDRLINSKIESVALATVKDLLDRTGHKPVERQEVAAIFNEADVSKLDSLSDEELKNLHELLRKLPKIVNG